MKSIALVLALTLAPALAACGQGSDPMFDAKVRSYILAHPEIIEQAMVKLQQVKADDALKQARAAIGTHRAAIERDPRDFVANPDGKITVTEFFDYRCTYCKLAAPKIVELIQKNPDVRFVFKELPIFGGVSDEAAAVALAARDKGASMALYKAFFSAQALDAAAIDRAILEAGLNPAEIKTAAMSPEIQRHLLDTHALAGALRIEGTPAFFIGDDVIAGADIPALKAAIARQRQKVS